MTSTLYDKTAIKLEMINVLVIVVSQNYFPKDFILDEYSLVLE